MSAFVLDNKHINVIMSAAAPRYPGDGFSYYWQGQRHYSGGRTQEIGQKLVDENFRSVNYRYNKAEQPYTFLNIVLRRVYSPVEVIKACNCYNYQACETPDWKDTEARAIVHALRKRAIRQLEGYDEAAWAIYDCDDPGMPPKENLRNVHHQRN